MGVAILRAANGQKMNNCDVYKSSLEEAIQLAQLSAGDQKWQDEIFKPQILWLLNELEKFKRGERTDDIGILYRTL